MADGLGLFDLLTRFEFSCRCKYLAYNILYWFSKNFRNSCCTKNVFRTFAASKRKLPPSMTNKQETVWKQYNISISILRCGNNRKVVSAEWRNNEPLRILPTLAALLFQVKQLFRTWDRLWDCHHRERKKNGNGYGLVARKTVGQGKAKVDNQTCAGDKFRNWLSASAVLSR